MSLNIHDIGSLTCDP